jgi:hypothetical protein
MESPDLPYVYYTERQNVPEAHLLVLETSEHSTTRLFSRDASTDSVATIRRLMEVTLLGRPVKRRR